MSSTLLMPKATAVWLVDNTSLTFNQIAHFCSLHHLEVKSLADGDSGQGIKGLDPILTGQLTREAIDAAQLDSSIRLQLSAPKVDVPELQNKGPRYTPVSKRQDRPNAILWLVRNHPELRDPQIVKLVGTTKGTITSIRDRSHWNISQLQPLDPVTLGICTQIDLDKQVKKATDAAPPSAAKSPDDSLLPASQTQGGTSPTTESPPPDTTATPDADDAEEVFKNFTTSESDSGSENN